MVARIAAIEQLFYMHILSTIIINEAFIDRMKCVRIFSERIIITLMFSIYDLSNWNLNQSLAAIAKVFNLNYLRFGIFGSIQRRAFEPKNTLLNYDY